jgi:mannonate dehydratase
MIPIAEILPSHPTPLWRLVRQLGVRHVVATLGHDPSAREKPWSYMPLLHMKQRFEDAGFRVAVIEGATPMEKVRRGLDGRDQEIDDFCTLVRNMGALGIPVVCYNFMAVFNWLRTSTSVPSRGGALASGYDHSLMRNAPLTDAGEISEERLWDNFGYFLKAVTPVAEKAGVKLALHPDDPPLSPIRGVARIMRSVEAFRRVVDMIDSECNGITLCQGNFALMGDDLIRTIREFGRRGRIHFVHLRDVRGTADKFVETFHDDGPTDLGACLRAYEEVGYKGVLRPDHVPTLEGDSNEHAGYTTLGRLFAIGYIRGLQHGLEGKPAPSGGPRLTGEGVGG